MCGGGEVGGGGTGGGGEGGSTGEGGGGDGDGGGEEGGGGGEGEGGGGEGEGGGGDGGGDAAPPPEPRQAHGTLGLQAAAELPLPTEKYKKLPLVGLVQPYGTLPPLHALLLLVMPRAVAAATHSLQVVGSAWPFDTQVPLDTSTYPSPDPAAGGEGGGGQGEGGGGEGEGGGGDGGGDALDSRARDRAEITCARRACR